MDSEKQWTNDSLVNGFSNQSKSQKSVKGSTIQQLSTGSMTWTLLQEIKYIPPQKPSHNCLLLPSWNTLFTLLLKYHILLTFLIPHPVSFFPVSLSFPVSFLPFLPFHSLLPSHSFPVSLINFSSSFKPQFTTGFPNSGFSLPIFIHWWFHIVSCL